MHLFNRVLTSMAIRVWGTPADDEEGQTLVEYGLIVALISIVAIGALTLVGSDVKAVFNKVASSLST